MEIEIVTQKRTAETIKVEIPCYIQFGECYMKIKDKNYCVVVKDYSFDSSISIKNMDQFDPFGNIGWKFIDAALFNAMYAKVIHHIESNK